MSALTLPAQTVNATQALHRSAGVDRAWLDKLGGEGKGLFSVRNGIAYETPYVVDAIAQRFGVSAIDVVYWRFAAVRAVCSNVGY